MFKLIPLIILALAGVPVPIGTVSAEVEDVRDPVKMLGDCLGSPYAKPALATITIEVLDIADGDDQQPFKITLTSHAHEDSVACLRDTVEKWAP